MYIPRHLGNRLKRLLATYSCVVVSGARQVGKSTLLRHILKSRADFVTFDPTLDLENARKEPDLFLANHRRPLVLDEFQYAPELSAALKRAVDQDPRPGQFLLSGSQQWSVMKNVADSLAGRAAFLDLEGFSRAELARSNGPAWLGAWLENPANFEKRPRQRLKERFPLWEQIWRGFLPRAQFLSLDLVRGFHEDYFRTYVERDARLSMAVDDWQAFGRFTRLCAALTAQEINLSQLGRELGIRPDTARRWLAGLVAGFQFHTVPAWSGNTIKRLSSHPKGHFTDTGLVCAALGLSSPKALPLHPSWGAIFETAVASELRKMAARLSAPPSIFHWRSHGGGEVDLVLERDGWLYPVEVKSSTHLASDCLTGIRAFRKTYPKARIQRGLVLAPLSQPLSFGPEALALPWDWE